MCVCAGGFEVGCVRGSRFCPKLLGFSVWSCDVLAFFYWEIKC